jgi:dUTP pyrophosphatase
MSEYLFINEIDHIENSYIFMKLLNNYRKIMYLKIFINESDDDLRNKYCDQINKRNNPAQLDHIDAGFDIYVPKKYNLVVNSCNKIDMGITCSAKIITMVNDSGGYSHNTGYYMYPRSSLSKTSLRLANSVGIIDSGYRGKLIGMFDCLNDEVPVEKYDRLVQLSAPGLVPIYVELVNTLEELGERTLRGDGGFGSTGR